ncbi:MAG TPA: PAS domain S-box protein, partial [Pseudomonas sp.]|nr:PAS domain S-box protein [Pseudomonas sp.]
MKIPFTLGLRGRLILLLLAAFAALSGQIVWYSIENRDERLSDASEHLLRNTQLIAARQQRITARADAVLTGLILRPDLRPDVSTETCSRTLAAILQQEPTFVQVGMTRHDGVVACAAVPPKGQVSFADRNWFQSALQSHDMVIGDVVTGRIVGKPIITFAKAQRDEAGRVAAVFYLSLNLEWLRDELATARLPEGSRLVVVDAKGTVAVRHPDPEGWVGKSAENLPLWRRIQAAGGEGVAEDSGLDGVHRVFGFTPLLDTVSGRMTLWLALPKAVVEAPVQRQLWLSLAFALAVLVATLGLAILGGNRLLLRPLLALARAAERHSAGDLGARSGLPHTADEIGWLARTLDESAATVEDREHRLAYANHALRVLSAGNRTLLRATSEQELLEEMCRAIIEAGGYRLAWVGFAEHDKRVKLVASWGVEADFLASLNLTWDETAAGQGPTGTAIRRGIPIACSNVQTDPGYAPWREQAQRYGYASSLALPLRLDGAVIGALCICSAEADAFDAEVVELLSEAANDLAYGIATQRAKAEHKRTQTELQRLERQNTLILDAAGEGIFGLDMEGRATFINPAGAAMLQWTAEEIAAQTMHALHHHTRADGTPYPREACPIHAAYRDGAVHRVTDEVFWRKDGTSFPVEYVSTPLRDERGELAGAVVSFSDVSKRKQAEEKLRETRDYLENLFNHANAPIIVWDPSYQITMFNHAFEHLTGRDANEVIGKQIDTLFPADRKDEALSHIYQTRTGERWETVEIPILHSNGEVRTALWNSATLYSADGKSVVATMAQGQDITERKAAEEQIRKLSLAVEQSPESIVITNLDAEIEYVNEAFVRATGYSREEAIGRNPRILQSGKTPRATYDALWQALTHGEPWRGEFINRRKDGSEYIEFAIITPIRQPDGRITHYVAVKEDITEKKRLADELDQHRQHLEELVETRTHELAQATIAAEAANQAKSAFLASMSHEIRTPMNGVIGMIDVLQQSSLNSSQMESANIIHDSAYSLLAIINDILDFSKIEAGKLQIDSLPMSVAEVVEGACKTIDHMALKKNVELTLFTDPAIPAAVMGDAGRLRQILINLANNAIKFSSRQTRQGKVSVRAVLVESGPDGQSRFPLPNPLEIPSPQSSEGSTSHSTKHDEAVQVAGYPASGRGGEREEQLSIPESLRDVEQILLEFRVTDNGIGMDEQTQARLFTAFTQADSSTTRTYGGTGLGLAISGQLANIMGGKIAVQSEPGKGSMFSVRLPFKLAPDVGRMSVALSAEGDCRKALCFSDLQNLPCLVVGGAESLADDLAAYLEYDGALVERVEDLAAANKWIAGRTPGLCVVVIDTAGSPPLATPLLDGLRVAARAHPEQQTR